MTPQPTPDVSLPLNGPPGISAFARFRIGLLALVTLVTLGLTAITAAEILRNREQAQEEASRQVQNLAKTLELHAQGVFRTADLAASTVAEALTLRPGTLPLNDEEVLRLMERLLAGGGAFRTLVVADANGQVRVDATGQANGLNIRDRTYFRVHQEAEGDRGSYISAPLLSRAKRGWVVIVSRRIGDAAGNFAGIAWAAIDLSQLEQFYASLDVGPSGGVTLWTSDGLVLARHSRERDMPVSPSQLAATIREQMAGKREGLLSGTSPIDGSRRVVAFRAVEGLPLYVSVRMAEQDYLAGWYQIARRQILELGGEILMIAVLTVLLLRHLQRLDATARALQESEQRARAIFDSTFQYMALLAPDGSMYAINKAGLEFNGADQGNGPSTNVLGCPAWKMRAWRNLPESVERMRLAVEQAAAGALVRFEAELDAEDGRHTVDCSVKPVRDGSGRVVLLVAEARDITERVHAAERLAQAKEQAEIANRIKSDFLATMSHELRTPLNAIIGFSEIMVHQVFGPIGSARYAEYAHHIHQSGSHLLDLINDVLDMSKLEAGRYTLEEREIRLDEVLGSCLAVSTVPAENGGVALVSEIHPLLPALRGDERAVRQVVLNLLSNAVKFTPPGGQVTLSVAPAPDGALEMRVADTGVGIEPAALARITEPFQQADNTISRRFGGTGLGLAISRSLTELHGGTLRIESTVGQGTTVTVRFPAERVVRPAQALEAAVGSA